MSAPKRSRFALLGLAFAALGGACALKFTSYPPGSGGATGSQTGAGKTSSSKTTSGVVATSSTGNPLCGNTAIDPGEQCDDGNHQNLDGCDSQCRYEAIARITQVKLETKTPAFCPGNANLIGATAITTAGFLSTNAHNIFDKELQAGIDNGDTNVLAQALYLVDLTGNTPAANFDIGIFSGKPDPAKGAWAGGAAKPPPLDWWFIANQSRLDANRLPLGRLKNGNLNASVLEAGPGTVSLDFTLDGAPFSVDMQNAILKVIVNNDATTPTPLPTGSLRQGLVVFQTLTGNDTAGPNLGVCGNFSVESLAKIPVPALIASGGQYACGCGGRVYAACGAGQVPPACNSLLDVLVGGCIAYCGVEAVHPSQPDVPAQSGGTPGSLTLDAAPSNRVIQTTQGNHDGYSVYMTFGANRARVTGVQ